MWWTPNDRIYYEEAVGDKPSVITSKKANSYQFKTGDLATNEYVEIVRQRAAACPNVEDIGARGEVLFVYFDQEKYVVKALGDLAFCTYQLQWSIGKPALNPVHEFGDSQIETLGEDVERIQTGLLRSVFQSVKKCSIQPGML